MQMISTGNNKIPPHFSILTIIVLATTLLISMPAWSSDGISKKEALQIIEQQEYFLENNQHDKLLALLPKQYLSESQNTVYLEDDNTANVFFSSFSHDELEYHLKQGTMNFNPDVKKTVKNIDFNYDSKQQQALLTRHIIYESETEDKTIKNEAKEVYTFKILNGQARLVYTKSENVIHIRSIK